MLTYASTRRFSDWWVKNHLNWYLVVEDISLSLYWDVLCRRWDASADGRLMKIMLLKGVDTLIADTTRTQILSSLLLPDYPSLTSISKSSKHSLHHGLVIVVHRWEAAWSSEKTGGELRTICPKPTKKVLKIHKGLRKAVSALIVQMRTEKIGLRKFLHSRKVLGFDSPECPCRRGAQTAKLLLVECRIHVEKRNRTWEKERRKVAFGRISWEEMLTRPKFAKKAAQFMRSLGLIDQFRSANFD